MTFAQVLRPSGALLPTASRGTILRPVFSSICWRTPAATPASTISILNPSCFALSRSVLKSCDVNFSSAFSTGVTSTSPYRAQSAPHTGRTASTFFPANFASPARIWASTASTSVWQACAFLR